MKKYFFFCLLAAALSGSVAQAQQAPNLRMQAVENTRKLAQQIALDDARTTKVKNLTYDRLVQENELKQMYSIDPALLQSKMVVVEQDYAEKLKAVLTDAQFQRFMALKAPALAPVTAAAPTPAASVPVLPVNKPEAQPNAKTAPLPTTKKVNSATHASTSSRRP
ncbi:hypothetical protein [Hymenobacter metallicola]|uniref:DUF4168 domain-containing protein n=1 Tax=Hymenobacter metallicola TaxID=2563114 RepID=A0A4Z0QCW8_9BACT|nr:hypothetical protein [Hymenobacter metallicola]TGE27003.1 hypothetical protein E5K02_11395 [Hymenobacter metallicola]